QRNWYLNISQSPCLPRLTLSYSHIFVAWEREARFSVGHDGGWRSGCQASGMDWGCLATAAWKKGGVLACGAGGPSGVVHPASGRHASAGDAVHALSAQWVCDGGGDVAARR